MCIRDRGNAGQLKLELGNLLMNDNASINSASTLAGTSGSAGQILIDLTNTLHMDDGSSISTSTEGQGNAGNIIIGASNKPIALQMNDGSTIQSNSNSEEMNAGLAGNLKIWATNTIDLHDGSEITTGSKNAGGGGIEINTRDRLHLQNSKITTLSLIHI